MERSLTVSSYGDGGFSLDGLSIEEIDTLLGAFKIGCSWVRRGLDGALKCIPFYKKLPGPADDVDMQPFWRPVGQDVPVQWELFEHTEGDDHSRCSSPSFTIQHLCGYGYTPENYKRQAELLESYGFKCLRSHRDINGQFWEIWFLPGAWAARGKLLEAIPNSNPKDYQREAQAVVEFLRRRAQFGTLDISVQRLAQVRMDD